MELQNHHFHVYHILLRTVAVYRELLSSVTIHMFTFASLSKLGESCLQKYRLCGFAFFNAGSRLVGKYNHQEAMKTTPRSFSNSLSLFDYNIVIGLFLHPSELCH